MFDLSFVNVFSCFLNLVENLHLLRELNIQSLLEKATQEYKVAFVPGMPFFINRKSVRLNFSSNTPENIEEGMKRLGEIFSQID